MNLGYKYEELLNLRAVDFLLDEESWKSRIEELKSKQKLLIESISKRKDGTLMPTEISMRFITHSGRDYVLAAARDITERKQAEEEKKRFEKQLEHSQRMGAIGQLAEGVAHDFNNILTAIVGYSSLLQMKIKDDNELKHSVEQIIASTERAADLTKSLLTFSRKQPISPEPVDINNIIKNFENFMKRVIGKDIVLNADLHENALTVMADTRQIEQVLINLVTNAKDAMPSGGRIDIQTGAATIGSDFVGDHGCGAEVPYSFITVKDSGIGMDEKTKLKIFEPFFTTKGIDKNTGLGLSIAYGIISQHDGYINVESEKNKGAEFKIYLPLMKNKASSAKPVQLTMPMGGTETVLVADDEDMIREIISNALSALGYDVITAVDGEDAINKFIENKEKVKVVILDSQMPKKPGKKVFEEINKINPDVKAIFMRRIKKLCAIFSSLFCLRKL
jgi:signal transduction histidine kinase